MYREIVKSVKNKNKNEASTNVEENNTWLFEVLAENSNMIVYKNGNVHGKSKIFVYNMEVFIVETSEG